MIFDVGINSIDVWGLLGLPNRGNGYDQQENDE
jgi:hypothetical protein